jgi:hypothetical protein
MRQTDGDSTADVVCAEHVQYPRTLVGNRQNSVVRQPLHHPLGRHLIQSETDTGICTSGRPMIITSGSDRNDTIR